MEIIEKLFHEIKDVDATIYDKRFLFSLAIQGELPEVARCILNKIPQERKKEFLDKKLP